MVCVGESSRHTLETWIFCCCLECLGAFGLWVWFKYDVSSHTFCLEETDAPAIVVWPSIYSASDIGVCFACLGPLILHHVYLQYGGLILLFLCGVLFVLDVPYLQAVLPFICKCTFCSLLVISVYYFVGVILSETIWVSGPGCWFRFLDMGIFPAIRSLHKDFGHFSLLLLRL